MNKVYKIGKKKQMLAVTTAVAEWIGLWCTERKVLGSSLASVRDFFFFFLSRKICKFFDGLMVPYVTVSQARMTPRLK